MTNDANQKEHLRENGWLSSGNRFHQNESSMVPLYEARMSNQLTTASAHMTARLKVNIQVLRSW